MGDADDKEEEGDDGEKPISMVVGSGTVSTFDEDPLDVATSEEKENISQDILSPIL